MNPDYLGYGMAALLTCLVFMYLVFNKAIKIVMQVEEYHQRERSYLLDRIQSGDPETAKRINLWEPPKERKPVPQTVSFETGLGLKVDTARTREEIGELES
jgi:hypothetical protein